MLCTTRPLCVIHCQFHLPIVQFLLPLIYLHKCPTCTIRLAGTNAAFLVPDHIQKKFVNGWNMHVSLTFLMDHGCLLKDRHAVNSSHDVLLIDNNTGYIITTSKPLLDNGELDLIFDEWHQAWHWLLELIRTSLLDEFPL